MKLGSKLRCVQLSDTGKVREHNEDAVSHDPEIGLLVLADGMGGYNAGEVASGIAVKTIMELVGDACRRGPRSQPDPETGLMHQSIALRDAVSRANKIIHQAARTSPQCEGMGTTLVACLFWDDRASVAHVGDSRLYRQRQGQLEQLTSDHSLLQELVDRGFYSIEEAQRSTNRNYVTRALGVEPWVEVTVQEFDAQPGDTWLLCSDGLSDMVEDEDIHLTISTFGGNLQRAGEQLIQLANEHGGKDNISVIMAGVVEAFPESSGIFDRIRRLFG
ncbi:MAG: Stp1/IreP family PP2C-type Ser/Thr phosphatase [Chromatiales bacterium]|nr:Stp1/IreP family PP2C-type Ser/Thr phosphatase [Chromatiales bacterium]